METGNPRQDPVGVRFNQISKSEGGVVESGRWKVKGNARRRRSHVPERLSKCCKAEHVSASSASFAHTLLTSVARSGWRTSHLSSNVLQIWQVDRLAAAATDGAGYVRDTTTDAVDERSTLFRQKVGVHDHGRERHGSGGAGVRVGEVVQQCLQLVAAELDFVFDDLVMRRSSRTNQAGLGLQVEIEGVRVNHTTVDDGAGRHVAASIAQTTVDGVESNVVTLATYDKCHLWVVARFDLCTLRQCVCPLPQ